MNLNAVLRLRRLAEVAQSLLSQLSTLFRVEKHFSVQNCNKGFSVPCILVANNGAARTKTSCYVFYLQVSLYVAGRCHMQKSRCQGFKGRTVQSTM